eukprot:s1783_g8.t1
MTWYCRACQINNGPRSMYCNSCQNHWNAVYTAPKRRSRSKSVKQRHSTEQEGEKGEKKESDSAVWEVFPSKAPWVPTTPAMRNSSRLGDSQAAKEPDSQPQPVLQQPSVPGDSNSLSPSEEKLLQHLKGLKALNMDLTAQMAQQLEVLSVKETAAASSKPLTHSHINKMNKLKNQLSNAAKRIASLDSEWMSFTSQTMEKIRMHAQLYQDCRADLLEQYNLKFQEFNAIKEEMSMASASMLGQAAPMMEVPQMPDITTQLTNLQNALSEGGPLETLDQIDLTEDDEEMEEEMEGGSSKTKLKSSPKIKPFRNSTSPQKVANLHLKPKPESKESKEAKKDEK